MHPLESRDATNPAFRLQAKIHTMILAGASPMLYGTGPSADRRKKTLYDPNCAFDR